MFFSKAQAFEVTFLRCLSSDFFHIPACFSFSTLIFSIERCSWDSRNSAVSLHWLARPRCTVPCDRLAGICSTGQIQEPTKCWTSGCSLQVGRTEIPLLCCPLNSEPTFASPVLHHPHTGCWSHWSSTHNNLISKISTRMAKLSLKSCKCLNARLNFSNHPTDQAPARWTLALYIFQYTAEH